ncbi:MAG TPA: hypothetical protein VFJ30_15890, partial [Phycisphaerae bacterium]|nr:hypothetical protein [Phycisphaerae bacterium]
MRRPLLLACVLTACCGVSRGIINPNFTPAHLVEQSKEIQAATLVKTDDPARWTLTDARPLKGTPAGRAAISLTRCDKDSADSAQRILRDHAGGPVVIFVGAEKEGDKAYMHAGGLWFDLQAAEGRWDLLGFARRIDGTYAGGTDML